MIIGYSRKTNKIHSFPEGPLSQIWIFDNSANTLTNRVGYVIRVADDWTPPLSGTIDVTQANKSIKKVLGIENDIFNAGTKVVLTHSLCIKR